MLTIKNIDKIIGMMCYDREIYHIHCQTNQIGEESYVFEFKSCGSGGDYNKPQEVHLMKNKTNDAYKLFVMGLETVTKRYVVTSDIKCITTLMVKISHCLSQAKYWWEHPKP